MVDKKEVLVPFQQLAHFLWSHRNSFCICGTLSGELESERGTVPLVIVKEIYCIYCIKFFDK